ncbi:MAG TPA: AraC family transcriptional regulator [Fulvivirga sp.]|nr:AraC family transcriptional regulator [Fulvivirga sp.]
MLLINYQLTSINIGPFFGLVYGPLFFFYTKALIYADWKFKKYEALHFLPSLLAIMLIAVNPELLYSSDIILIVTIGISLCIGTYLYISYRKVMWFQQNLKNLKSSIMTGNLNWLRFLIISTAIIFTIALCEAIISQYEWLDNLTIILLYLFVLLFLNRINNKGLKQPEIFYGITNQDLVLTKEIENKYSTSNLTDSEALLYIDKLSNHMSTKEPFLQFEISLEDLANQTDIPSRYLSQILNERFNKNFFDFVNGYRIERAKNLLLNEKLRINEVMYDAGFSSKSTFNHVFKKEVGCTPSNYRRNNK